MKYIYELIKIPKLFQKHLIDCLCDIRDNEIRIPKLFQKHLVDCLCDIRDNEMNENFFILLSVNHPR